MKLLQFTNPQLVYLQDVEKPLKYLIVESQEYGNVDDFRYHIFVPNELGQHLIENKSVREIKDTGRTVGFWQRLGGRGVYLSKQAPLAGFRPALAELLSRRPDATLSFKGKTWRTIIKSIPAGYIDLEGLGFYEKSTSPRKGKKVVK